MAPRRHVEVERWFLVLVFAMSFASAAFAVWLGHYESSHRISGIQKSRAEIAYTNCLDQNGRHDKTIERLDVLLEKAVKANPEREMQIRASRASTIFLIEALAPHQNCAQLSVERFGYVPDIDAAP
jgi:hypothetical protein